MSGSTRERRRCSSVVLVAETAMLRERFGEECRPLGSLWDMSQAMSVLRGEMTVEAAVASGPAGAPELCEAAVDVVSPRA